MELISKYDVIKALQKWNCRDYISLTINPYEVLRDIPIIEERKEGKWVNDIRYYGWTCTHCNYHDGNRTDKYCPNCGAKMEEESNGIINNME